ncbi:sulfur oxidation c-type cytochrome SoxX [Massilia sp. Root351]|jgi:sulfur-oxidizing protein SoxX|uniref:sulfur oxidation c-type cytochrome SoxX n=1 Tax=Massilia sp. Root351 TaxID=1736522 RepID=UPI0007110A1F|nr:sulfur oxidation c-type cytochrome SoxX [Massilia sp. Root351]KQV80914.1 sulfur oxidation c-type cytochrome SoxX [Massilia sp. Root351]
MKYSALMLASAAAFGLTAQPSLAADYEKQAQELMKADFRSKGPATVEGVLQQDDAQKLCSQYPAPEKRPKKLAAKLEAEQLKLVKYPSDGQYMGRWQEGEKIAQNGRGMQSSDKPGAPNGGNCYACHQLAKAEISFGNIGPSLYQYGKLRGDSEAVLKYTWAKLYNSQAFSACSNMPRFGHKGILDEQQLKDVLALLMDPASPVNKD